MSLTVKAYLTRAGQPQPEIRRFAIDADVAANYNYFIGKLTSVFPGLQHSRFTVAWKDSDGDEIVFSSDEELILALGQVSDGVFKVYVQETAAPQTLAGPAPGSGSRVLHPGVRCDGCDGPVQGKRFKCEVCVDFDLCEACRSTGLHSDHGFRCIETPLQAHQFPFGPQGMFHCLFGSVPPPRPPMGSGMAGMPPMGPGMCPPPMGPGMCPPPPPMAPGMQPSPNFWGMGGIDPAMLRQQRRAFRHWMKQACRGEKERRRAEKRSKRAERKLSKKRNKSRKMETDDSTAAASSSQTAEGVSTDSAGTAAQVDGKLKDEKKKKHNFGEVETSSSSSSSSSSEDSEGEESPGENYLKNVGQSVAALLNPLGIDVSIDIEHRGRTSRVNPGEGGSASMGGFGGIWGPFCPPSAWTPPAAQQSFNPESNKDKETRPTATSTTAATAGGSPGSGSGGEMGGDWTFIPAQLGTAAGVEGATRGVASMSVNSGGQGAASTAATAASPAATAASSAGPATPAAPNEAVRKAVELMKSMGFNDDDGWLTTLLTSLRADVNAALDFIRNNNKQQ